jgi:hypothetical protein
MESAENSAQSVMIVATEVLAEFLQGKCAWREAISFTRQASS